MEVDERVFELAMAEEHLDGPQISPGFEEMRGKTMPQRVGR
jgi:hypothetical protein